MIRRILISIDTSEGAQAAFRVGSGLAAVLKAECIAVFVEDERRFYRLSTAAALAGSTGFGPVVESPLPPEELILEEEKLDSERSLIAKFVAEESKEIGSDVLFFTERGLPGEVLYEAGKRVDLIVIGCHGSHRGLPQIAEGNTTEEVLRTTTRPVLVVPNNSEGDNRLVIAYNGTPSCERTLCIAAEFATLLEINDIDLLTVDENEDRAHETQDSASDYLGGYNFNVSLVVRSGEPAQAILQYAEDVGASFIAMGAFGRNRILEAVFGSTTKEVLKNTDRAVLLMP